MAICKMLICVNVVQEWLSPFLPLEEKVANYPPQRMQGTMIRVPTELWGVVLKLVSKIFLPETKSRFKSKRLF